MDGFMFDDATADYFLRGWILRFAFDTVDALDPSAIATNHITQLAGI